MVKVVSTINPVDFRRIQTLMKKAPRTAFKVVKESFKDDGQEWKSALSKRNANRGGTKRRTGNLVRSLNKKVRGSSIRSLSLKLTSAGTEYAAVQEFGGFQKSSRPGGFLTIPLKANMTPAGVTRRSAKSFISKFKLRKDGGRVYFTRTRKGDLIMYLDRKDKRNIPVFRLVKRVTIPGPKTTGEKSRFGFFDTWDELRPSRIKRRARLLKKALNDL